MSVNITPSFKFRNITNYIVEPVGEPVVTQPANYSIDFSPQASCMDEAPDDGKQYGRQNKSWTEVPEIPEIPTKTSDLTNDSGFITEETDPVYASEKSILALKTDLTKESLTGLKITDNPEFADELITGLKSDANGGDIPAATYTWFKGIFPSLVDGSVKSYIIGLLTVVKDLATRVGLLEDKYILKYVVPVDTAAIDLTTDRYGNAFNFVEGDEIEIVIKAVNFDTNNRINIKINNNANAIYYWYTSASPFACIPTIVSYSYTQNSTTYLSIIGNEVIFSSFSKYLYNTTHSYSVVGGYTNGLNAQSISSINLVRSASDSLIKSGTIIIIKKK